VLNSRLAFHLDAGLGGGAAGAAAAAGIDVTNLDAIRALPPEVQRVVLEAFTLAMDEVFLAAVPFAALALVLAFRIPEVRLKTRADTAAPALEAMG
jgi:hypothetical protein